MKNLFIKSNPVIIISIVMILSFFQFIPQSFDANSGIPLVYATSGGEIEPKPIVKGYDYPRVYPPMLGDVYPYQFVGGLEINDNKFNFTSHRIAIPTQMLPLYVPATIKLNIFDERIISEVTHAAIFFIQSDRDYSLSSDPYISWDRSSGIEVNDPAKVFGKVSAIFVHHDTNHGTATFSFTPVNNMNKSTIITRLWDYRTAIGENIVANGLQFGHGIPIPVSSKVDTNIMISSHISDFSDYLTIHKFRTPSLADHAGQLEHMFDHTNDGRMFWKIDKTSNEITMTLESPIGHPYLIKHETLQKNLPIR